MYNFSSPSKPQGEENKYRFLKIPSFKKKLSFINLYIFWSTEKMLSPSTRIERRLAFSSTLRLQTPVFNSCFEQTQWSGMCPHGLPCTYLRVTAVCLPNVFIRIRLFIIIVHRLPRGRRYTAHHPVKSRLLETRQVPLNNKQSQDEQRDTLQKHEELMYA